MQQGTPGDRTMRDTFAEVEAHARGMWRYRWLAVAVMWVISIAGWLAVYSLPPVYEANARIYVDTENALRPLLKGIAISANVINEVKVVTRELLSRPNLAEVARNTDIDLDANTEAELELLLTSLQRRIKVKGSRDNIFSISFQDPDREKAVNVVAALVTAFVEKSLGADRSESRKAQVFLQTQINEYEARLTTAEDRLAKFKRDNVAFMPGKQGGYFARFQAVETLLSETRGALRLAQERRAELLRQLQGEEPLPAAAPGAIGDSFAAAKIRELQAQLEELRLQYTDKHPRIGQILDTIDLLKKQQQDALSGLAASGPNVSQAGENRLDANPVYQNMRIQLSNTEVDIAALRAEFSQRQQQVAELKELVDTVPQVEAELGRLDRDYDVVNAKYHQLVTQLETANIGEDVDASIDEVQFRIIDPPFAGLKPAGPKRQLFLLAVLLGALGLGGALTFLLNQLHPVFFSAHAVTTVTGLPVLGAVSFLMSPEILRDKRRGHIRFALAIGVLFVSFALVSLFAEQLSPSLRNLAG